MVTARYSLFARALHWISALIAVCLIGVGLTLHYGDLPDGPSTDRLYNLHESFGVTLWVIVAIRLLSRWAFGVPPLPSGTPSWVKVVSTLNHAALYVVLLAQPIIGFLANSAGGYDLDWFNVVNLPAVIAKDDGLSDQLTHMHDLFGWTLVGLVVLHLLGGAYHARIRKDGIVSRMI